MSKPFLQSHISGVARALKIVMAVGAAAALALVVLIVVTLANRHSSSTSKNAAGPTPRHATSPAFTPVPATPSSPSLSPAALCAQKQQSCGLALLQLINRDRARHHRAALVYDAVQSNGSDPSGSTKQCGSTAHSQAMASTGRLWHRDAQYASVSYPNNICGSVARSAENVASARGAELTALQRIEQRMLSTTPHGKNYHRLMSRRFRRIGIGIARSGNRWFLTEDFLA